MTATNVTKMIIFNYFFQYHCRFLVPGITQKILTEIWHHFWLKMMIKSGLEKNILKFHQPLQSCCCPVQKNLPRKCFFLDHFSPSFLSQKYCQISVRIFCVMSGTRNLQWIYYLSHWVFSMCYIGTLFF